jgi:hypothetical protein
MKLKKAAVEISVPDIPYWDQDVSGSGISRDF